MPQAVKLWQTAFKKLQQLPSEPKHTGSVAEALGSGYFATNLLELLPTITELFGLDRPSSSEWKQLVNELQVIECAEIACFSATQACSRPTCHLQD